MPLDGSIYETDDTLLLMGARSFIERGFTQHEQARDILGRVVLPTSPDAVQWCVWGSLVAAGMERCISHPVIDRLRAAAGGWDLAGYNNTHSKEEVLAVVDRAIEISRGVGP